MRNKPHTADRSVARVATRQHGVVAASQLLAIGLSHSAIHRRAHSGRLFRVHRGVYAVGHPELTERGRWMAATLALGFRAVLSHRSAAELWGLLSPRGGPVDVTAPYPASPATPDGVRLHRSRPLARGRTTSRDGVPVTMPARTLADLAVIGSTAEVHRATRAAEKRGLPLDPEHQSDRADSALERDFLAICRRYGVAEPECNVRIGRCRVDFLWREQGLVIETDGSVYHRGRRAMRDDDDRDIELELSGLRVTRIEDSRIDDDPAGVAHAVLGLLARRR